jgi:hypothetical protein
MLYGVSHGVFDTNKKINYRIRETNLLSLINLSLAQVLL